MPASTIQDNNARPFRRPLARALAVCLGLSLLTSACSGSSGTGSSNTDSGSTDSSDVSIAVTTDIWASVVNQVVCESDVEVTTLMPAGTDPHAFEPSLKDRTYLDDVTLVVANGLHLEGGFEAVLESIEADGGAVLRLGETLGLDDSDPHFWFDPILVSDAAEAIANQLIETTELDEGEIQSCTDAFATDMFALDQEIKDSLAAIDQADRQVVTNHDSLGYFADRYDVEIIGTVLPSNSSLAETNPADLERLRAIIEEADVPAIFSETQHSGRDASALANDLGIKVIELQTSSLGDYADYQSWLTATVEKIVDGLS